MDVIGTYRVFRLFLLANAVATCLHSCLIPPSILCVAVPVIPVGYLPRHLIWQAARPRHGPSASRTSQSSGCDIAPYFMLGSDGGWISVRGSPVVMVNRLASRHQGGRRRALWEA